MPFQTKPNRRTTLLNEADEILREKRKEDAKREADELMKAMSPPPAVPSNPAPNISTRPPANPNTFDIPSDRPIRPNPTNSNPGEIGRFSNKTFGRDIDLPLSRGFGSGPAMPWSGANQPLSPAPQAIPRPAPIPMDKPAPKLSYPSTPGNLPKEFGITASDPAYQPADKPEQDEFKQRVMSLSQELKALGIKHVVRDLGVGTRSQKDQDAHKAAGRSQLGGPDTPSPHALGIGADILIIENGKIASDNSPAWKVYGDLAKKRGFVWGGDWKTPVDKPHIQLRPISKFPRPIDISKLKSKGR